MGGKILHLALETLNSVSDQQNAHIGDIMTRDILSMDVLAMGPFDRELRYQLIVKGEMVYIFPSLAVIHIQCIVSLFASLLFSFCL